MQRTQSPPGPARSPRGRAPSRSDLLVAALVALVAVASALLRWPGFRQGGFASHDVAGILYGGMLLDAGALPYVDSIELKPPGSFYLAWSLAGEGARDIARFQVWANLWALASLVAVAGVAWRAFGRRSAVVAALVYGLHDAHLDSMDANYVTWAQLPAVLAAGAGLMAGEATGWRRLALYAGAGALGALAALIKQPAGVVLLALVLWVLTAAPRPGGARARARDLLAIAAGALLAHLPVALHYAAHGALGALVEAYVFNPWGLAYVRAGATRLGLGHQLREGTLATAYFLGPALVAAAYAFAATPKHDPRARARRRDLCIWALSCVLAAWVGFRFYKGYFLAASAPLAVLAAAPWGLGGRWPRAARHRWLRACVLVALVGLVARQAALLGQLRADRARPHDLGGRAIAEHVLANSAPGDRVWVWGWHLWDVYPLTGQRSGSRVYKSLGLLTPPNDDSWRRPASAPRFLDGPAARIVVEDLERTRPRYIVLGSTAPWREFHELRALLGRHYTPDRRVTIGRVRFFRLRDDQSGSSSSSEGSSAASRSTPARMAPARRSSSSP